MLKKIEKINEALPGMLLITLLFGVICQTTIVWFVSDKATFSIGLWIGIAVAFARSFHLAWSLNTSLELGEGDAGKHMIMSNTIRYIGTAVVLVVLAVVFTNKLTVVLAAFLGIMSTKVAAYAEPFTHKLFRR